MDKKIDKNWSILICLALLFITIAVFYQVRRFDFISLDDKLYVYDNPNIQTGITLQSIKCALTTGCAANWHPLTWLSHMFDWQLYGDNAGNHHITNLIFHIANTLLLFIVLKQMTSKLWQSAFVAALFALHPLHVESVAWVAERKDVLSTFFWMLTMWAYVNYVNAKGQTRRSAPTKWYFATLFLFALGLMSKPMLITLPFVLLLLDYWPLERFGKRTVFYLIREKIPFIILSVTSSVITFFVQRSGGAVATLTIISIKYRVYNAFISYVKYIEKMFWPNRLAIFYPHSGLNVSVLNAVISAVLLIVVTMVILRLAKNHRYLITGWFWYLGTLVPVIGLIQVGGHAMADRYSYVALTGLFIIISWGVPDLLAKWQSRRIVLWTSSSIVLFILTVLTYLQLQYWRNSITLYQHALAVTKNNYAIHFGITQPLLDEGRIEEAIRHSSEAVRMKPDYADAINALGASLHRAGKIDEAICYYESALKIAPNLAGAHLNLAAAFMVKDRFADAVAQYEIVQSSADTPGLNHNHKYAKHLAETLWHDPNSASAHYGLGQILEKSGKINEAVTHFEKALQLKPDWVELMNGMAWILAVDKNTEIHNPDRAVSLSLRACELTNYKEPELLDTLAVAYAAAGDFDKAAETEQKALGLCQSSEWEAVKEQIKSRLVLFKNKKPYIEK